MKPPSYPILDNRPIHQWKVTELKEELKRRRLPLKGLKEDLVRRLDEALRAEMEADSSVQEEVGISQHKVQTEAGKTSTFYTTDVVELEQVNVAEDREAHVDNKNFGEVDVDSSVNDAAGNTGAEMLDATHASTLLANSGSLYEAGKLSTVITTEASEPEQVNVEAAKHEEAEVVGDVDCKRSGQVDVDSSVNAAVTSSCEKVQEPFNASSLLESNESVFEAHSTAIISSSENISSISSLGIQGFGGGQSGKLNLNSRSQPDSEDINQPDEDVKLLLSDMNHRASEVSPSFGVSVKKNSVSTDSVSINEKMNALKDDVLADDVKLESDVKTEMVIPSSSHVVSGVGESHPMDVEAPHENKISVEVSDNNNVTNVDVSTKKYSADLGSPEKLNLDRSSGDDSMEEDTLESKLVEERSENTQMSVRKEDNLVDVCDDICTNKNYNLAETNTIVAASAEKRKLPDEQIAVKDEPSKRQRRWKNGSAVATEPQSSSLLMATTPRATPDATSFKCSFSRNNSNVSEEMPKERVVPPASELPTDSLRIDNFLRPFTLKAVQELLGKTGTVSNFWMDQIKTHCYVTYSSVEEAIETRNAVYNLQWPPNGGKLLTAEFVDAQEVKSRLEGPPPSQPPVTPVSIGPPSGQALPSPREQLGLKQKHLPPQQHILPPPLNSNVPPPERERVHVAPLPPLPEKVEPPIVTLDDLFRKTKATPRIYYLPLSEEQVKGKLEARRR